MSVPLLYLTDKRRHLVCLPYSIQNLHRMARELYIHRCWFHRDHYDLPKRRQESLEAKCRIITPKQILYITLGHITEVEHLETHGLAYDPNNPFSYMTIQGRNIHYPHKEALESYQQQLFDLK